MKRKFGTLPDGREVACYTVSDGVISCELLDWGAAVRALRVPDRDGVLRDVVLGFDFLEAYIAQDKYLGATVGRFANRIGGAAFTLDGVGYSLAANDGKNHLHGGICGFDRQLWTAEAASEQSVTFCLTSPDGQEGYPATLRVQVRYTAQDGALTVEYTATADRPTLCNLTNHSYFNLNGHASGSVLSHSIQIFADRYTPNGDGNVPTGEISEVAGSPMDLREPTRIGTHIDEDFPQLRQARGYDHNYIPNGEGLRRIARAESEQSGIALELFSTQAGVQFYTGNYLAGCPVGKDGAIYRNRDGFCLETQALPDAPHHAHFPSAVLRPDEVYRQTTVYRFSR